MKLAIISFTENGIKLSQTVAKRLSGRKVTIYTKCSRYTAEDLKVQRVKESLQVWTAQRMAEGDALLFIGACGIAVRAIAPNLTDKLHDVPVLVMDEEGRYVIPILSGHVGGANELARELSDLIDARPVITTATDVQKKFAVDLFAKRNHLEIMNKDGIAKVSTKALAGEQLTIAVRAQNIECYHPKFCEVCEEDFTEAENPLLREASMHKHDWKVCGVEPPLRLVPYVEDQPVDVVVSEMPDNKNALIWLRPRRYVVGMGCRKNKDPEELLDFYMKTLEKAMVEPGEVYALASIDKKKDEPGLLAISERMRIPFFTYTAEELNRVGACVHSSEFVKAQVGVDNVCERAALAGCGANGTLIYEKQAFDGMTIAIAERNWSVILDEE
ncbi:MAG: cobalt-precorrin 5A hydrolase [Lachnobacterium sp.]|nr:cobalt-precorrin 5A hydrolase [Lachnobacterium sp.]